LDPGLTEHITECRRIIGFRNILIHGYAEVDPRMVLDIIETKLPRLRREVRETLTGG